MHLKKHESKSELEKLFQNRNAAIHVLILSYYDVVLLSVCQAGQRRDGALQAQRSGERGPAASGHLDQPSARRPRPGGRRCHAGQAARCFCQGGIGVITAAAIFNRSQSYSTYRAR